MAPGAYTEDEDDVLCNLMVVEEADWIGVVTCCPGRTAEELKGRWSDLRAGCEHPLSRTMAVPDLSLNLHDNTVSANITSSPSSSTSDASLSTCDQDCSRGRASFEQASEGADG